MATDKISGKEIPATLSRDIEGERIAAGPIGTQGKLCRMCEKRVWASEFSQHIDEHLDTLNNEKYVAAVGADIDFDQERFNELID
jgi:hypothetical protein